MKGPFLRLVALTFIFGIGLAAVPRAHSACTTKIEPPNPPDSPVALPWLGSGPKVIPLVVTTNTSGTCTLVSGKVRVLLVLNGVSYYCGDGSLGPKGSGRQSQLVSVNVPLGAGPRIGVFQVQRYVTAVFSDGSVRTEKSTLNFSSKNCIPLL